MTLFGRSLQHAPLTRISGFWPSRGNLHSSAVAMNPRHHRGGGSNSRGAAKIQEEEEEGQEDAAKMKDEVDEKLQRKRRPHRRSEWYKDQEDDEVAAAAMAAEEEEGGERQRRRSKEIKEKDFGGPEFMQQIKGSDEMEVEEDHEYEKTKIEWMRKRNMDKRLRQSVRRSLYNIIAKPPIHLASHPPPAPASWQLLLNDIGRKVRRCC